MGANDVDPVNVHDPGVIYTALKNERDIYHSTRECPHVSPSFLVIDEDDPRANQIQSDCRMCQWCKYEADDTLELNP